jgi:ABC-type transport system substrate-binding protein
MSGRTRSPRSAGGPPTDLLVSRRGLLKGGAGLAGAAALAGRGRWSAGAAALQGEPQRGGELSFALSADPPNLDPHIATGTAARNVKLQVYNGLMRYWSGGVVEPDLAESYEGSPDGLTYTFKLRSGVQFHDGGPLTSADVKATIERIQADATGATRQVEMQGITKIDTPDDLTVVLTLDKPNAALLEYFALPELQIISKAFLDAGGDPNTTVVGTGPFKLVSREPGVRTEVERNPNYFRPDLPYLDRVVFVPYIDENTRMSAVLGGEVDLAEYVPWKDIQTIEDTPGLKLASGDESAFMTVIYNLTSPPFDNPLVRKALGYAYDRQAIVDAVFFDRGSAMTGGLIPSYSWAHNPELEGTYAYDPERAKQLLTEAGVGEGVQVTLLSTSQYGMHQSSGEIVQKNLQDIGIDCQLELYDWSTVVQRQTEGNYQFRIHGLAADLIDPDFLTQYFTTGTSYTEPIGLSNPEFDRLLEEGRTTLDQERRHQIYAEFERLMLDQAPWSLLAWRVQAEALKEDVQGYEHLPGGIGFLSAITLQNTWRAAE